MITDDIYLDFHAGDGGDGKVSFRREKFIPRGGPDGGNGGNGGNVYVHTVSNLSVLNHFKHNTLAKAQDGGDGGAKKMFGARGEDLIVKIPIGSTITDTETGDVWECTIVDEEFLLAKGGYGGKGNHELRSNENKTPREAEKGRPGQKRHVHVNLAFIADIGLIGLPSAGKSSLLNELTAADAKVGDYPFTTLEPNLGVCGPLIIADIPGLIEGAHTGKGLGIKFLKHIQKTRLLLHCIDVSSDHVVEDYLTIRKELEAFSDDLLQKKEIVLFTKTDLVDALELKKKMEQIKKYTKNIYSVSLLDNDSLQKLKAHILQDGGISS